MKVNTNYKKHKTQQKQTITNKTPKNQTLKMGGTNKTTK